MIIKCVYISREGFNVIKSQIKGDATKIKVTVQAGDLWKYGEMQEVVEEAQDDADDELEESVDSTLFNIGDGYNQDRALQELNRLYNTFSQTVALCDMKIDKDFPMDEIEKILKILEHENQKVYVSRESLAQNHVILVSQYEKKLKLAEEMLKVLYEDAKHSLPGQNTLYVS